MRARCLWRSRDDAPTLWCGKDPAITETNVNRNQVKGTAKDIAGKVQETAGQVTGSTSQQIKGVGKQIEGKLQKGVGDIQEAAKDTEKRTRP